MPLQDMNIQNELPSFDNLQIPAAFKYDIDIPTDFNLDTSDFDDLHFETHAAIYSIFPPSKAEEKLIVAASFELAKVGAARANTTKKIECLKQNFDSASVPRGMRVKFTGIKSHERQTEITAAAHRVIMEAELEHLLANYHRLNSRYAAIYPELLINLKAIIELIEYPVQRIDRHSCYLPFIDNTGGPVLSPIDSFKDLNVTHIQSLLSRNCHLNPRSIQFLDHHNSHISTFKLNEMKHAELALLKQEKAAAKKKKFEEYLATKSKHLFQASNAESTDDKLNILINHILTPKNSKGKGKLSGTPSTKESNNQKDQKSSTAKKSTKPPNPKGKPSPQPQKTRKEGRK